MLINTIRKKHDGRWRLIGGIYHYFKSVEFRVICLIAEMHETKLGFKRNYIYNKLIMDYSMVVSPKAKIGDNIQFPHSLGIVIGDGVVIDDNCIIYQNVTLGQWKGKYPKIGKNVIIYPGAKLFGDIIVGNNSVIGANAVVNKNVDENSIVAGIPAHVIGKK